MIQSIPHSPGLDGHAGLQGKDSGFSCRTYR